MQFVYSLSGIMCVCHNVRLYIDLLEFYFIFLYFCVHIRKQLLLGKIS